MRKPSAFWLRGGLPKAEAMADEFTGSVYGAAALGYMAVIHALDACDMLEERCPRLLTGNAKSALRSLTSVGGEVEKLRVRLSLAVRSKADASWLMDFGNAAYGLVKPHIDRLQFAVGNMLGRYPKVADITSFAAVLVAYSLASEATKYVERRKELVRGWTVTTSSGRESASTVLGRLSCAGVEHQLKLLAEALLAPCVPDGTDLSGDPIVKTGCNAVLNALADTETWKAARNAADRLRAG